MMGSGSSRRIARQLVACVAIGLLVASCGDDDDSTTASTASTASTATPATPFSTATSAASATTTAPSGSSTASGSSIAPSGDVCADREALRASVDALKNLDLVAEGTNGATAAVTDVKERSRGIAGFGRRGAATAGASRPRRARPGGDGDREPRLRWCRRGRHGGGGPGDLGADVAGFAGRWGLWSNDHADDVTPAPCDACSNYDVAEPSMTGVITGADHVNFVMTHPSMEFMLRPMTATEALRRSRQALPIQESSSTGSTPSDEDHPAAANGSDGGSR